MPKSPNDYPVLPAFPAREPNHHHRMSHSCGTTEIEQEFCGVRDVLHQFPAFPAAFHSGRWRSLAEEKAVGTDLFTRCPETPAWPGGGTSAAERAQSTERKASKEGHYLTTSVVHNDPQIHNRCWQLKWLKCLGIYLSYTAMFTLHIVKHKNPVTKPKNAD